MTNLSPDRSAWRHRITRERVLVTVPALLGLALATGVFAAVGSPTWDRLDQQRQRITELESKRDTLPLLEAQLKQSDQALSEAMQQQALLVDLLAGRGQIQTFLAQLSRISSASGVVINLYEPMLASPGQTSGVKGRENKRSASKKQKVANEDPLAQLGYEKTAVLLQVEGPYQGLLEFLRRMEQLELLVEAANMELTALGDASVGPPRTRLKLKLSFFDQASQQGEDADRQQKGAASNDSSRSRTQQAPS